MGRDPARIAEKDRAIRAAAPQATLDWVTADFSSMAEVRRAVAEIGKLTQRIDVLVNNAGLMLAERSVTPDGFETTFAVNHLAPFLLTTGLLPLLQRGRTHIINVSSFGHTMIDDMRWDDLQMAQDYGALPAYAQTKLANVLFTRELAQRFAADGIVASAVHPGFVYSRFHLTGGANAIAVYETGKAKGTALTEDQGADTVVWLATTREAALPSGGYFAERQRKEISPAAQNPASPRRLWEISERLTGLR
jgi:NAD(P)-dependent dehydrogenase (short-subunit alcohol dehydrogenase family)